MVFVKHNSLKSDIFFNPIFFPGFSGSGSRVQGPSPQSRVRVQSPGPWSRVQGPGPGSQSGSRFQKQPNYSTIFRSIHRRYFMKKAIIKHFVIFTGKHLYRALFFNKVAGHQSCNFIKKRLQHRYYLANIRKFIRRTILKNISERLHCWKVFCENVFHIRSELSKRNY